MTATAASDKKNKSNQERPDGAESDLTFGETAFSFLARRAFKALN